MNTQLIYVSIRVAFKKLNQFQCPVTFQQVMAERMKVCSKKPKFSRLTDFVSNKQSITKCALKIIQAEEYRHKPENLK